ncbi:hypothetical protein Pcac1_g7335 [Phytophthora cactorum]|nr:hypothetical protein Pcac1_g7335 [Phytophthora cactorum]
MTGMTLVEKAAAAIAGGETKIIGINSQADYLLLVDHVKARQAFQASRMISTMKQLYSLHAMGAAISQLDVRSLRYPQAE